MSTKFFFSKFYKEFTALEFDAETRLDAIERLYLRRIHHVYTAPEFSIRVKEIEAGRC